MWYNTNMTKTKNHSLFKVTGLALLVTAISTLSFTTVFAVVIQPGINTIKSPIPTSIPTTKINSTTLPVGFAIDYAKSTFVATPTTVKADGTSLSNLTATI